MTANIASLALRAASAMGVGLEGAALGAVSTWLSTLQRWNARMDLTAARSDEELVDLMLADAMVLAPRLPAGSVSAVDVGSGAGAPGLAVALLRAEVRMTLVEPRGKRTSFLRAVIGELGRTDVAIARTRGETLRAGGWDVAMSRATLAPAVWLDLATRLVVPRGEIWVLVAGEAPPTHPRATLETETPYVWPLTGASRRALLYRNA